LVIVELQVVLNNCFLPAHMPEDKYVRLVFYKIVAEALVLKINPSFDMKKLQFSKGDFFGGLTTGIVALPLALAFGAQSGLGAAAGLYGAIFLGFFAAAFGGTPCQVSGPTGPMTVVSASVIAGFSAAAGSVEQAIGGIVACFIVVGVLQIIMGIIKLGSFIKYIPYPVISGFMSGIGVIIILLQLFPALGSKPQGSIRGVFNNIGTAIAQVNYWALFYTVLSMVIIYLFPKITKAVPGTLVALVTVTLLSLIIPVSVPVIGDIPKGFPELQIKSIFSIDIKLYNQILIGALTLAALGAIDSLLTSVVADNITKTRHNSNRELIGQGIGNSVTGMFGGIPGAGATMRTLVNIRSGGRNRISGIIHSITLLIILLGAGRYASLIPNSVLAGILITVGIGILDYKGFRHLNKVSRAEAAITIIVLLVTVFFDLLMAVGIGLVLASLFFMKTMSDIINERTKVRSLGFYEEELRWPDEEIPQYMKDNVIIKHIDGPLFFGSAAGFHETMIQLAENKFVIIRMEKVPLIDQTGSYALEESVRDLKERGMEVLLTGLQKQPESILRKTKIIPEKIQEENLFANFKDCINWIANNKLPEESKIHYRR
jgi:SulP family sulfate permease